MVRSAAALARSAAALAIVTGLMTWAPGRALAQNDEGSAGRAIGGAALGAASGSMLALTGGLVGCNRTLRPSRCSRITTVAGAAIGLTAGAAIGWRNDSGLDDRLESAAWGAAVGALVGLGLKKFIRQYEWIDVAAASVLGLAVGASAQGSGFGFAVGGATGLLLWRFHPTVGPGGAVAWALGGMAVGGLADWVVDAVRGGGSEPGGMPLSFSVAW